MTTENKQFAIIGGTGLTALKNFDIVRREIVMTPYGEPSSPLAYGCINNHSNHKTGQAQANTNEVVFLARHGHAHSIPPHMVNYRANLFALKNVGVTTVIAVNAVGGIRDDMSPGSLVIPDQIIDYTTSRINTFFEKNLTQVTHIDFSYPYSSALSQLILKTAKKEKINIIQGATYAATEGPRLETAAEIQRLKQDGCDIVGMTGMPEAALARELEMGYVSICVNANWAAGLSEELITMEAIEKNLEGGLEKARSLLAALLNTAHQG
ncbi:MAG: S-methyl-5'-thioinosine phosphorylase [gamma proteobacterium symbiont of Bathyaustriella thionipta]|nr:S-methyl-5'-thioinosine phosphorylase [gamma proteobacterium symbiont of Bathyaustriella thionipta]MCU7949847.1 S-methyl-5'-thioinosine phosphorylase [gamma proteobacterium symbiont of Bathyaustriella thionipta]MCU7954605.1 S-methyl-5'-thioinosine phosphorylase [gamma proteobacterium symbiont of Bathyaustriella thionipta]MCU7956538.1 S-methyl-5'-thioinosine phosphorylase [gamma proteobacterium symbiont of Bathyaustriella thionipta]